MNGGQSERAIVDVDVGGSNVKGVVVAASDGGVVARVRCASDRHGGGEATLVAALATVEDSIRATPASTVPAAVGLESRVDVPVWFGHDVHAGSVAEFSRGAAQGVSTGVFVPVGTGIAAALVVQGRHHRANGLTREIGHLDRAVDVTRRARSGDAVACQVWLDAVHALGYWLSWVAGVVIPKVIVIGGGLARAGEQLMSPLRSELARRLSHQPAPELIPAALEDEGGALGSALLALNLVAAGGS